MLISERKIGLSGNGAMLLCLPIWWIRSQGLAKGDSVIIALEGEDLKITPKSKEAKDVIKAL